MSRHPQRLGDYLQHILVAGERIGSYVASLDEAGFELDALRQDAVIRNLEVIGEASRNILRDHPEFVANHPGLPLAAAYEMRNVLSHAYFKVDLKIVWRTLLDELPSLMQQARAALKGLDGGATN